MAQTLQLTATPRTTTGKGAARSLRRTGRIPAVIYGHGRATESLELDAAVVTRLLGGLASGATMIDLTIAGREPVKVLIRDVQRDPVRPSTPLHLDLYEVRADEVVTLEVPVHLVGIPDGVRNFGGVLDHPMHKLEIEVLPAHLPSHIDVDVTHLGIGQQVFVRDIVVPNAKVLSDPDQPVCTVVPPRTEPVETPVVEEATAEPELIRKPKADEDEADEEE